MAEDASERLIEANEEALRFYLAVFRTSAWSQDYLAERRLDRLTQTGQEWHIGYAPDSWSALIDHLRHHRFTDEDILAAGLAVPTQRGYLIDRFRDRLMFPIRDLGARTLGFVGRAHTALPKYVNTRATTVFRKSELLYGLSEQRDALQAGAIPVFVEGPSDVLAIGSLVHDGPQRWAGLGLCGTTLTPRHLDAVREVSSSEMAMTAFDGDVGGRAANRRAFPLLLSRFAEVRATETPRGQDPSSLYAAERGDEVLTGVLNWCRPLASLLIDDELRRWAKVLDHISGKINAVRAVAPIVAGLPRGQIAYEVARLTRTLSLDHDLVTLELAEAVSATVSRDHSRRQGGSATGAVPPCDPPLI
ncbi:toprim domain-containing protein [Kribbella deserti]|uniref:Toprim domain-containing protein n=1 Tax=Kribbella deserti TaxID=1926257 RepID=A0ABV6QS43_9ACTN